MTLFVISILSVLATIPLVATRQDIAFLFSVQQVSNSTPERTYRQVGAAQPSELYFVFDGLGGSARRAAHLTAFHNVVPNTARVIYPEPTRASDSVRAGWNAGFCCGSGWINEADDIGFIKNLIVSTQKETGVLPQKTFLIGFSNGAMFIQQFAVREPHLIGGLVSVAGSAGTQTASLGPAKPVPIMLIHGRNDQIVPLKGGVGSSDPSFQWLSFADSASLWAVANKCQIKDQYTVDTQGCLAPLVLSIEDYGHEWPGWRLWQIWRKKPHGSQQAFDFLHTLTPPNVRDNGRARQM